MRYRQTHRARALIVLALIFLLLSIGAATFSLSRPETDPFQGDAVIDPPFTPLTYSVQGFMWWGDTVGLHLDWTRLLGFSHIKQTFAWEDIEVRQDEWDFEAADRIVREANARGIGLIVRLSDAPDWAHPSLSPKDEADPAYVDAPPDNLDDWADFCGTIAGRYAGQIAAYQIWNEPNLTREWGYRPPDSAGYVELLRVCSEAIRQIDPNAILISAGLSSTGQYNDDAHRDDMYLQEMYNLHFQQYIDVVGVHAPGHSAPEYGPDDAERDGGGRWQSFRRVEDLRKIMIANGDAARQMAILEMGYTTDPRDSIYNWFAVSEAEQAQLMEDAYRYIAQHWTPWVGLVSAVYLAKPDWTPDDEQFWWAFNDPQSGRMRPVFGALAQMEKYCGELIVPRRNASGSAFALVYNPCR